jgi:hypothetical protein
MRRPDGPELSAHSLRGGEAKPPDRKRVSRMEVSLTTFRRNALPHHNEAVVVLAKDGIGAYRVLYVDEEVGRLN